MADKKISALPASTTPLAGSEVLPVVQSGTTKQVSIANLTAGRSVATGPLAVSGAGNVTMSLTATSAGSPNFYMAPTGGGNGIVSWTTGQALRLATADNASLGGFVERVNIDGSGNTTLSTGNLVIGTSGKGIDFSADGSAAGMTSELLDDYEEGEISDYGISFDGVSTGIAYASGRQNGKYTKIGNTVYFNGRIELTSKGSATGVARITGLPFAKDSTYNGGIQLYFYYGLSSVTTQPWAVIENNATTAVLKVSGAGATVNLTDANFNNDTELVFSGFYFV